MILTVLQIFNLMIWIAFIVCEVYCLYRFCMGEKGNSETLWYGLFALIVCKLFLG